MHFGVSPANRAARIAASLILAAFSIGIAGSPVPAARIVGVALFAVSLTIACVNIYQSVDQWLRRRSDPYDLSKLWDMPEPDEELGVPVPAPRADDLHYCHRCGASMSGKFSVCPDCGHRLGY